MLIKSCRKCQQDKELNLFVGKSDLCKICRIQQIKEWTKNNPDKRKAYVRKYHKINKEKEKVYCLNNKDKISKRGKEYRYKNKDALNQKLKVRRQDLKVKLRHTVSVLIRQALTNKRKSCIKYLSYSFQELKEYLEKQFEHWMNWDNWGLYKIEFWKDDDSSTWTWQLDHIIPQSDLPYTSMEDDNFKKCWALDNLRPYSSKQNILDGVSRVRHNK